jgi:hypothetical protein
MTTVRSRLRHALGLLSLTLLSPYFAWCQPPSIVTPPANISTISGSNATLMVTASGAAPLFYQWQMFGTNLPGRTNDTLALTNININNGGIYAVRITNASGPSPARPSS